MARKSIRDLTREQQMARGPIDLPFLMLTMLLLAIGLVMLLSASSYAALYDKAVLGTRWWTAWCSWVTPSIILSTSWPML